MKAVLVIDVNDDINFDEAKAYVSIRQDSGGMWFKDISIKPMPRRFQKDNGFFNNTYVHARNEIIDEILGETDK